MRFTLYLALTLLLTCACSKDNQLVTRNVDVLPFDHIELKGAFDLILTEGEMLSVRIDGFEKSISQVNFNNLGDTLYIIDDRKFKLVTPKKNKIKIYISSPPLKRVKADGGSFVSSTNPITSDEFGLVLTGKSAEADLTLDCAGFYFWNNFPTGGKLTLTGSTQTLKLWNTALMSVNAEKCIANTAFVENDSKGDCIVNVQESLTYSIGGTGNIRLYGNPGQVINNGVSSTGELIVE